MAQIQYASRQLHHVLKKGVSANQCLVACCAINKSYLVTFKYFHTSIVWPQQPKQESQIDNVRPDSGQITVAQKVVQTGKDATYLGFVVLAVGIAGVVFYAVFNELFSSQTPQGVYTTALKKCKSSPEVCDELGDSILGRGEMTARGRARYPDAMRYDKDGVEHMRMKFYLRGSIRNGTAEVDVRKNENNKWETRYLFVQVDKYPYKTIVIEDNR